MSQPHVNYIKYKFIKFKPDSGIKLLVSKNIMYFAECAKFSQDLQPSQKITVTKAMDEWEKIANVKFIYEENNPKLFISATDLNYFTPNSNKKVLGAGWEINFKAQQALFIDFNAGHAHQENSMWLLLHELGHVPFQLKHIAEYSYDIVQKYDNTMHSVMSYNHNLNQQGTAIYPITPSHYDISLVQKKFGVSKFSQYDDIYKFSTNTIGHQILHDIGGIDTIDLSNFNNNLNVSIVSGTNIINNISSKLSFGIFHSSIIENIITGDGNDTIFGNDANNKIIAGKGNNTIYGGEGKDIFIFNKNDSSFNLIKDFKQNEDKINLKGFGLNCDNFKHTIIKDKHHTYINPEPSITIAMYGNFYNLECNDFIFS